MTISEESQVVTDGLLTVDATGWRGVAGWIILVASVAVVTEGIVLALRYLNPRCMNNNYTGCGGLVRLEYQYSVAVNHDFRTSQSVC